MRLLKKKMILVEEYTLKCSEDGEIDINVPIDMRNTMQKQFFCPHDDGLAHSQSHVQHIQRRPDHNGQGVDKVHTEAKINMNRKTMLKRLKAGDDPIDVSISKWQDIRKKVEQGKIVDLDSIGGDNCALCHLFHATENSISGRVPCGECPLCKSGQCCNKKGFDLYTCDDFGYTACDRIKILRLIDKMIEALNEAKEYES